MDMISELPKEILQRILYLLTQEEAVRTSVLSKSWRYIWCTRPNLDLSDRNCFKGNKQEFLLAVDKTLQRYCDQKMCLEEFRLSISLGDLFLQQKSISLLEKWIPRLTYMGVKGFRLFIFSKYNERRVKLPPVVFETESLQYLHVDRMIVDHKAIERILPSKHLKQLIIQNCVKVEENELHNLMERCSMEIYPTSLETIDIRDVNIWFRKGAHFGNLVDLSMYNVESSLAHFSSCKFPSLKCLTFFRCHGFHEAQLFIDAPNIVCFKYAGDFVPSISFATVLNEWNSEISLRYWYRNYRTWFLKLKELLKSVSQSKISLDIYIEHDMNDRDIIPEDVLVEDNGCIKPVVVESLYIDFDIYTNFSTFLNVLFCVCRPRNIDDIDIVFSKFVWEILMQREGGDQNQFRQLWLLDLEEVSIEIYDRYKQEWHPTNISDLPSYRDVNYHCSRYALKWRETL